MKAVPSFACAAFCAGAAVLLGVTSQSPHQFQVIAFVPAPPARHDRPRSMAKGGERRQKFHVAAVMNDAKAKAKAPGLKAKKASNKTKKLKASNKARKQKKASGKNATTSAPKSRKQKGTGRRKGPVVKTFKPLKDLKLGSTLSGTVVDVCDFGAFVSIGYATRGSRAGTALLHISQIRDEKIENIHDVIKVGDRIADARVITIDSKKGEVGLSLRKRRPKRKDLAGFRVGESVEGRVSSVVPYGAFVDVGANVNALLHISRITGGVVENVRYHLNESDSVSVRIIDIDKEKKTMAVSMLDKKADQYLDRRMSQRLKRFYGTASTDDAAAQSGELSEVDYFDKAIRELEDALRG